MILMTNLPQDILIFPLSGALLLPRGRLPLHIVEPRYLAMIDDCLKGQSRLIGMVQSIGEKGGQLNKIGCAGRVAGFSESEDGHYMITLSGVSRFELGREVAGPSSYRRFEVDWTEFSGDLGLPEHDPGLDRDVFMTLLRRYFDQQELRTDWDGLCEASDEALINSLAMVCPFLPEEKQALLQANSLLSRREILTTLMEFSLLGGTSKEMM